MLVSLEFEGQTFTQEELCRVLALLGSWEEVLREARRVKCMPGWAERLGVSVTEEQVQEFADSYRAAHDMYEASQTEAFLRRTGLSEDDLYDYCQAQALRQAVREKLSGDAEVHAYFMAHLGEFDRARLSRIVVESRELAKELRMRIAEDGEQFQTLARTYSRDDQTRHAGGYVGVVRRRELGNELSALVFASEPGALVGPVEEDEQYHLILVEELLKARLDDAVREEIKDRLLEEWERGMLGRGGPAPA